MAYSKGLITIPQVSGNIVITVTTEQKQSTQIPITWKVGYKCNYVIGDTLAFSTASDYSVSDFVTVSPNTEYTLKELTTDVSIWSSFRVIACDSSNTILSIPINQSNWTPPSSGETTFTTPANCTKIVIRPYTDSSKAWSIELWT